MTFLRSAAALAVCIAVLASAASAAVTPPNAKARVFGVSPNVVALKIPGIDKPSNGLPNVAKGSKVYLYCGGKPSTGTGTDVSAQWFKSATFNIFEKPAGSNAALSTIDTLRVSFVPDIEGTYRIEMTGTDNVGRTDGDTLVVNVAKYVGVGKIVGTSATPPECSVCHSQIYDKWVKTNHASAMQRKLDDPTGHFGPNCLSCHNTGATDPDAEGDGFLHLLKATVWKFPTALKAGNFDSLKLVAPELAKLSSIQCESCHGPGSAHNGVKADNKIAKTVTSENCRQCHDAPPYHQKVAEWENSAHKKSADEPGVPEYMNRGSTTTRSSDCARCHTSNGYIDVFHKSPDPATAFTKAPYKDLGYIGCATCHDPHSNEFPSQLRKEGDKICADCHTLRVSSRGLHSSHQGSMLQGVDGKEFAGYTYPNSTHTSIAEQCVQCHMAAPPDKKYQNLLGGHSFRIAYDNGTPTDPSDDVLNSTGCMSCHVGGITLQDLEETQDEIKTLLAELAALLPKTTTGAVMSPTDTTKTLLQRDAAFNYFFVNNDGSFGVHNDKYAKALLEASIAEIKKVMAVQIAPNATSYELSQNYPNPFNPSTTITFSVPTSGQVRIAVYDASGREVNLLVNGYYTAGTYQITWNGSTVDNMVAPSGVYFCRMVSGSFVQTRKMALVK